MGTETITPRTVLLSTGGQFVKSNNPHKGTETQFLAHFLLLLVTHRVKLNNPPMGTETLKR